MQQNRWSVQERAQIGFFYYKSSSIKVSAMGTVQTDSCFNFEQTDTLFISGGGQQNSLVCPVVGGRGASKQVTSKRQQNCRCCIAWCILCTTEASKRKGLAKFQHQLGGQCKSVRISVFARDGSYGLLRRPIRINTLLIRNTRIIRKRIFAILGGTLGLHQPPSNHHELSPQPPEHYNASW